MHDSASGGKGRAGEFCGSCHNFGRVNNLAVPLKGGHLFDQGAVPGARCGLHKGMCSQVLSELDIDRVMCHA